MATLVSVPVRSMANGMVHDCGYKSAVLSGIVPNAAHLKSGGYHCSVNDLRAYGNGNDYSNTRPDDRNWNPAYGAAVDVSMSKADLVRTYGRVHAVWADHSDPRRKYFNAVNVWDGSGDATRLNFDKNTAGYADDSHKFHVHAELRRRYVLDAKAARAMVSMFAGDSTATWIASEEATGLQGDDDMATISQTDFNARMDAWWLARMAPNAANNPQRTALRVAPWQQEVGHTGVSTHDQLFGAMLALLQTAAGQQVDVDEDAIAAAVLASLTPEKIVAGIPEGIAQQVVDLLGQRMQA
jgi:hypothetical protein